ncbi:GTPase IMAP family member 4 [Sardina pilchardus]|uniref:GTPase IMAP family member 4 n=1 Tax=Sardina pilchardus TaxID=27697 RepID=UPI002E157701
MRTRRSQRKHAVVRGQRLTLVDTPGWEWFSSRGAPSSSIAARKEMVAGGAELCQPGAHGLLLVVPLAYSFGGRERHVVEEHVEMFGQRAWGHTLVLFTVFDSRRLRDSTLEEEVEENEDLQALVDKCGGRYHALHGRPRRGEDQVAELLQKIQAMVEGNGGTLLPSEEILLEASKREEEKERREEEDMRERERELRRMREALKLLEEEEDADDEDEGWEEVQVDDDNEFPMERSWRASERQMSEEGDDDRHKKSAINFNLNMSGLRSSMRQSCKTQ